MVVFTWILSRVQHKIAYFVKWLPFRPWKESGMSLYPKIFVSYCPSSVPNFMLVSPKAHFFYISARLSIRPFIIVGGLTFVIDFFAVKTRGGLFRTTRWWPILRHLLVPCVGWHSVMVMGSWVMWLTVLWVTWVTKDDPFSSLSGASAIRPSIVRLDFRLETPAYSDCSLSLECGCAQEHESGHGWILRNSRRGRDGKGEATEGLERAVATHALQQHVPSRSQGRSWTYDLDSDGTYSLFQFGSRRLDSHNIHKIKSENLD